MSLANLDKILYDTWNISRTQPNPNDNIRAIWFGGGQLRHAHSLYKNIQMVHGDIWSWREWGPEVLWIFHMRLKVWMASTRYGDRNEVVVDVLDSDVPKDIVLYNALLGE